MSYASIFHCHWEEGVGLGFPVVEFVNLSMEQPRLHSKSLGQTLAGFSVLISIKTERITRERIEHSLSLSLSSEITAIAIALCTGWETILIPI
jgi:hypothetical protein